MESHEMKDITSSLFNEHQDPTVYCAGSYIYIYYTGKGNLYITQDVVNRLKDKKKDTKLL